MLAAFFKGKDHPLEIREMKQPVPVKDQVLVKLHAASLNHRDLWVRKEQTLVSDNGTILGSDGAGVVEAVGEEGDPTLIGREVIINPGIDWGKDPAFQADSFKILGYPDNGTFAPWIVISKNNIHDKPEHLTLEEAAAVPLSALTAYRCLFTKARLRPGEKVLITGIGGGTALWALQLALGFHAKVYVTSSSKAKIARAMELGAAGGFDYRQSNWTNEAKKSARGFDVIIDSAAGPQFKNLLDVAAPGGRIVVFGRTAGDIGSIPPRVVFNKQLTIMGSLMGTRDEFLSMLDFIEKKGIKPVIDSKFPLEKIEEAFVRMQSSEHFGKVLLIP
ncbi:MAG TPA: zinc-binding dehydrogenase [Cyclobacteriaceae bacterium]